MARNDLQSLLSNRRKLTMDILINAQGDQLNIYAFLGKSTTIKCLRINCDSLYLRIIKVIILLFVMIVKLYSDFVNLTMILICYKMVFTRFY